MIIGTTRETTTYSRRRHGKKELCVTDRKIYHLRCDECGGEFYRYSKDFNTRSAAHVCNLCDPKKFAQRQSAILRKFNKYDASSSKRI